MSDTYSALRPVIDAVNHAPMRIRSFTDQTGKPLLMAFHEAGNEYGAAAIVQRGKVYVHGGTLFFSVDHEAETVTATAYTSSATGRIDPGDGRDGELVTKLAEIAELAKQITL